nr:4-hydroxythreonine-4-phosphate dehydrogenase PdxA [Govania unica]
MKRPLAVTMGEPAGIGPELVLKAWLERDRPKTARPFYVIAPPALLRELAVTLGLPCPIEVIATPDQAASVFDRALPVIALDLGYVAVTSGKPSPATGRAVIASIEMAVQHVKAGLAAAVVTNPIQKSALYDAGFKHPGHTEFLAALCADQGIEPLPVMMLAVPELKVVPLTVHIPLSDVAKTLTADHVVAVGRIVAAALKRDFAIAEPRLAIAGLNPHAGEDGRIGREEQTILAPAIARLQAEGITVIGPLSADAMFHAKARARYDVALCGYHDQALIPLKTIDFDHGVNVTLGLPIIRTSPDHGTALDLAGQGIASALSLIAAMRMADDMANARGF